MTATTAGNRSAGPGLGDASLTSTSTITPYASHPLADEFELMEGEPFDALVADIKQHGLHEPIVLHEDKILDGRNRYRACHAAGVEPVFRHFSGSHADAVAFVISANILRRHLNREQRGELLIKLIVVAPGKSDRQIAKAAGVDHHTVAHARARGEDVGRIPHVATRTDTRGRKQPAKLRVAAKPSAPAKTTGLDILAAWDAAPPAERTRFVDGAGLRDLFTAAPPDHRDGFLRWLAAQGLVWPAGQTAAE